MPRLKILCSILTSPSVRKLRPAIIQGFLHCLNFNIFSAVAHVLLRFGIRWVLFYAALLNSALLYSAEQSDPDGLNAASQNNPISKKIKGLVLVGDPDLLSENRIDDESGFIRSLGVEEIPDIDALNDSLRSSIGKLIIMPELKEIKRVIINHYKARNRPFIIVMIPRQSVRDGYIKFMLHEGKISDIRIEGNEYYSNEEIAGLLSLEKGGRIEQHIIGKEIKHINSNPFLKLNVVYEQGSDSGETDAVVQVKDKKPFKIFSGIDNLGKKISGTDRIYAGLNLANVFGPRHLLHYQFTSNLEFRHLFAHSLTYDYLLPFCHTLSLSGSYADAESIFQNTPFTQKGSYVSLGMYYRVPLKKMLKDFNQNLSFGLEYKQSKSALYFNSLDAGNTLLDVVQLKVSYSVGMRDSLGITSLQLNAFLAPGGLTHHSMENVYATAGYGSNRYLYGRADIVRKTRIYDQWTLSTRIGMQLASTRLPSSEQMSAGGSSSVRGYDEQEAYGDRGFYISNEIVAPAILLGKYIPVLDKAGRIQFLLFSDYANVNDHSPGVGADNPNVDLLSAGIGCRYTIDDYLSFSFDYGWQLKDSGASPLTRDVNNSRGHLSMLLNY